MLLKKPDLRYGAVRFIGRFYWPLGVPTSVFANIRVVKTDGSPITVGTAIVRYIGMIINSIIFGLPIGWLWVVWDPNKQGWHDKIAGTYVITTV